MAAAGSHHAPERLRRSQAKGGARGWNGARGVAANPMVLMKRRSMRWKPSTAGGRGASGTKHVDHSKPEKQTGQKSSSSTSFDGD